MFRRILCLGLLVIGFAAAPAAAQYPDVRGSVEDNVISGSNCPPGSTVTFTVVTASGATVGSLGSTMADANGNFSATVDPSNLPNGNYNLIISCGGQSTTIPIEVSGTGITPPDGTPTPRPPAAGPNLARTGSDSTNLVRGAAVLIAAGGLLLVGSRRRRPTTA